MKNNKKGVSVIGLVAAVTIIIILLATVTVSGLDTANNAKKIAFGTEINMLQSAVDAYYTKNNATFPVKDTIVLSINNSTPEVQGQFANESTMVENNIILYEIDYNEINIESLKYGRRENGEKDIYVLSKETGKVYYAMGLKIGNNTYFTNTDDIDNLLSYNEGKNTVNSPLILFEPSTTDWAKSVDVSVKVPKTYIVSSVKVNDNISIAVSSEKDNYNIYTYSNSSAPDNYYITVNYKEVIGGENKTAKYTVNNVDNQAPEITVDNNKVKIATDDNIGYMKVLSKSDNLSGIKKVKYDYGDFSDVNIASTHFENGGIEITDDIIFIKEQYDKITVYIEDNAGNFRTLVLDSKI